ncbi:MAG: ribose-5-phosphate isomerase RpiA [Spirochaetia bacterium]|nr:ribose-5-phosphate isomerase RpiA [Spirochaetia bacterium]
MKSADSNAELKRSAALSAAAYVKSGDRVGLGTGSTSAFVIQELGRRMREEKLLIQCVTTSYQSLLLARGAGLNVVPIPLVDALDVSIDGADEIDPDLNLIKGGGAAHTMEKLVHALSKKFVVVADSSKLVPKLGTRFAIPVEVIPAAAYFVTARLKDLGCQDVVMRMAVKKDGPVITENGNIILDAKWDVRDPQALERQINVIPGVLDNGIFSAVSVRPAVAIIAGERGVETKERT